MGTAQIGDLATVGLHRIASAVYRLCIECIVKSVCFDSKARDVNMKVEDVVSIKEIFDPFDQDKTGTLELEETQMQKGHTL